MDPSRLEIEPDIWLDSRRAVYLASERTLCVADLHLGYAWAHRFSGQLLPLVAETSLADRLCELCEFYKPKTLAILGDIVHRAVPVKEIAADFATLVQRVQGHCGLKLILGNHDRNLRKLLPQQTQLEFHRQWQAGRFWLIHGNGSCEPPAGSTALMGHEHPAITLGDNVRSAKFPCFLYNPRMLILPAFSQWAAGSDIRVHPFMSPLARNTAFTSAIAILGAKLLPVKYTHFA